MCLQKVPASTRAPYGHLYNAYIIDGQDATVTATRYIIFDAKRYSIFKNVQVS